MQCRILRGHCIGQTEFVVGILQNTVLLYSTVIIDSSYANVRARIDCISHLFSSQITIRKFYISVINIIGKCCLGTNWCKYCSRCWGVNRIHGIFTVFIRPYLQFHLAQISNTVNFYVVVDINTLLEFQRLCIDAECWRLIVSCNGCKHHQSQKQREHQSKNYQFNK